MVFSSLEFLFLFLPATLLVYFVAPLKLRNLALLLVSLVFYGWGGIEYLPLMLAVILVDYLAGFLIEIFSAQRKKQKAVLLDGVGVGVKTPVLHPKTIADAGELAREILKKQN